MIFRLDNPTDATLATFTARTETHGKERIAALTLGLTIAGPNTILDLVSETLRQAMYRQADDQTEQLDGIDAPLTVLRTKELGGLLPIVVPEIKGGTLFVEWGLGEDMEFGECTVKAWRAECFDGGSAALHFKVSTNDVSEEEAGHLFGKQGQVIRIRFEPPAPVRETATSDAAADENQPVLDGITGREVSEPSEAWQTAEEAFAAAVGDGESHED
jgi:hypothetical protein